MSYRGKITYQVEMANIGTPACFRARASSDRIPVKPGTSASVKVIWIRHTATLPMLDPVKAELEISSSGVQGWRKDVLRSKGPWTLIAA